MREIKFRAWDKKKLEMCKGVFAPRIGVGSDGFLWFPQEDDDLVLMQYSGLKDKNGKEIYEGDIVCTEYNPGNHENCHKQFHDVVEYKDGAYSTFNPANGYEYGSDPNECEVLGNIYENTELVQSK